MRMLLAAVLVTALTGILAASALAATKTIKVGDDWFVRPGPDPTVTVSKGTRARFRWVGDSTHNVRVTKGPRKFSSPYQSSGTFKRKLRKRGTYELVCDLHPGMGMTLKVR